MCEAIFWGRFGGKKWESRDAGIWGCCAGAVCCVGIPSPALRWYEALSQPPKKNQDRKIFPTQKVGAESGISGEMKKNIYISLVYYYFPPLKRVTGVFPVLKRLALPERARRGFPRRCFPSGEIFAVCGGKPFAPGLDLWG